MKPILFGLNVELEIFQTPMGELKQLTISCTKDKSELIMHEAVKRGFPFEKFDGGIKIFQ